MESFEDRVQAARAEQAALDVRRHADAAKHDGDVQRAAQAASALAPQVLAALEAVRAVPDHKGPQKVASEREWRQRDYRDDIELSVSNRWMVSRKTIFVKSRFRNSGVVVFHGWTIAAFVNSSSLSVTPDIHEPRFHLDCRANEREACTLAELVAIGIARWPAGGYKDSRWDGGMVYIKDLLEELLSAAAAFVVAKAR